jgi:hypothetical protein
MEGVASPHDSAIRASSDSIYYDAVGFNMEGVASPHDSAVRIEMHV